MRKNKKGNNEKETTHKINTKNKEYVTVHHLTSGGLLCYYKNQDKFSYAPMVEVSENGRV